MHMAKPYTCALKCIVMAVKITLEKQKEYSQPGQW